MRELIEAARSAFAPILARKTVRKGTLLVAPGERSARLFLVQTGLLRSFHVVEGREVDAHFALEDGVVGAIDSIVHGRESRYGIDALEDTSPASAVNTAGERAARRGVKLVCLQHRADDRGPGNGRSGQRQRSRGRRTAVGWSILFESAG